MVEYGHKMEEKVKAMKSEMKVQLPGLPEINFLCQIGEGLLHCVFK